MPHMAVCFVDACKANNTGIICQHTVKLKAFWECRNNFHTICFVVSWAICYFVKMCGLCDLFILNLSDLVLLLGCQEWQAACKNLCELFPRVVYVADGGSKSRGNRLSQITKKNDLYYFIASMWPIAIDDTHSVVCLCVCLCLAHVWAVWNWWTDWDDSCGLKETCIRWGSRLDKSIHSHEGWQVGNAAICRITSDTCLLVYRGQEADEKLVNEGGSTWAEQTDAEERAAAAVERQVYSMCRRLWWVMFFYLYYCIGFVLCFAI